MAQLPIVTVTAAESAALAPGDRRVMTRTDETTGAKSNWGIPYNYMLMGHYVSNMSGGYIGWLFSWAPPNPTPPGSPPPPPPPPSQGEPVNPPVGDPGMAEPEEPHERYAEFYRWENLWKRTTSPYWESIGFDGPDPVVEETIDLWTEEVRFGFNLDPDYVGTNYQYLSDFERPMFKPAYARTAPRPGNADPGSPTEPNPSTDEIEDFHDSDPHGYIGVIPIDWLPFLDDEMKNLLDLQQRTFVDQFFAKAFHP